MHNMKVNKNDIPMIKQFKESVTTQLQNCWNLSLPLNKSVSVMYLSTAVDP